MSTFEERYAPGTVWWTLRPVSAVTRAQYPAPLLVPWQGVLHVSPLSPAVHYLCTGFAEGEPITIEPDRCAIVLPQQDLYATREEAWDRYYLLAAEELGQSLEELGGRVQELVRMMQAEHAGRVSTVYVTVEGGVVQDAQCPPGVQVEVHDYDVEGIGDSEDDEPDPRIEEDDHGDNYLKLEFGGEA